MGNYQESSEDEILIVAKDTDLDVAAVDEAIEALEASDLAGLLQN